MKALLFSVLISIVFAQNSTCYSNCKVGYCDPSDALSCTDCDLGLVNINNACVGTSTLSVPIQPCSRLLPTYDRRPKRPFPRRLRPSIAQSRIRCWGGRRKWLSSRR